MKNKTNKSLSGWLFIIMGVVILIFMAPNFKYVFTGSATDINDMIEDGEQPHVRDRVSMEVTYVIDWYAELRETKRSRRRTTTVTTYHCLALLDNYEVISISVKKNSDLYDKLDDLRQDTASYINGYTDTPPDPVEVNGTIRKLNSKIKGNYEYAASVYGFDSSEVYMLEIDTTQSKFFIILLMIIGAATIGVGVYFICISRKEENASDVSDLYTTNGVTLNTTPRDTASVESMYEDPVFNQSFYDRQQEAMNNTVNHYDDPFATTPANQDENSSSEPSKFTLKKD